MEAGFFRIRRERGNRHQTVNLDLTALVGRLNQRGHLLRCTAFFRSFARHVNLNKHGERHCGVFIQQANQPFRIHGMDHTE